MDNFITGIGNFKGEFFALGAALLWAISSVLFRSLGKTIRPLELNLLKGIFALILLSLTSLVMHEPVASLAPLAILMLVISGALGIGFGDTMYFEALNTLGARRTLLLGILAPPLAAIFALIFLNEKLALLSWFGILITIAGVTWVITEKSAAYTEPSKVRWVGVAYGFLFAFAQAAGAVISRWALTQTSISALQSAILRLAAGIVFLLIWVAVGRQKIGQWIKAESSWKMGGIIGIVVIIGAYLAIWFQQLSIQFTNVGVAQTLLSTSPLFILPIAALQKEKVSWRAILGVLIAFAGVSLLFLSAS